MKNFFIPVLCFSSLLITSCKNDDNIEEIVRLPKTIKSVETDYKFQYNTENQLIKVVDTEGENEYTETLLTYSQDGKLTKFVNAFHHNGDISTFSYSISYLENNQLKITDEDNEYTLVTLNEKGQALSFKTIDNIVNFSYDTKGNITKIEDNNTTTTVSYNNDKGILSSVKTPHWIFLLTDFDLHYFAVNNPITISSVYENNGSSETYSQTNSYPAEHVILGYPTRMSVNYNENGDMYNEVFTVTY